ncbi:MAG: glycosyltransferase family 4 protein [Sphingomonas bacterium]
MDHAGSIEGSAPAQGRRILVLLTDAFGGQPGGIALHNRDLLRALCGHPDTAEVVALPRLAGLPLKDLPDKLNFDVSGLGGTFAYLRALGRQLMSNRPFDAVYCGHINLMPLAVFAARILRVPLILGIHGIDAWEPSARRLTRLAAGHADRVLSVSRVTLDRFRSWCTYPETACTVMPNAIHLDEFGMGTRDAALAERYGLIGRRVVMTLGRLAGNERYKGFDEVLEAMPALISQTPDIIYVIAGDGGDRGRLEEKAASLGIADHVIFTGMVAEEEKAALYRLADAYVMPSRGEGFGFVLLEAMACGVPTIASTLDGGREALRDGMLGELVDPGDGAAVIEAILRALDKPRGIPAGLEYFSFPEFSRRLNDAIDRTLATGRR